MYKKKYVSIDELKQWASDDTIDSATKFYREQFVEDVEQHAQLVDAVEMNRDYWIDRFEIQARDWKDSSGNVVKTSFVISYKEDA